MENKKVVVGMSGGVDSSVTAYLLKQQGYDVIGVTMQIWQDDTKNEESQCCGLSAVEDARRVANKIDIPFYVMNFKNEFNNCVIKNCVSEYEEGRTPNPCIMCNKHVKWEALLNKARAIGADYIATGHYGKITKIDSNGRYALQVSDAQAKDQTYVLYNLTQDQLEHTLMPLGIYTKDKVREIAKKIGLGVANKPDSQEICFIPDNDYGNFLNDKLNNKIKKGNFIDKEGNVLGKHNGIIYYTIGQRKGLGISFGKSMYVVEIRKETNEIVLGDNEDLFKDTLIATNINFMAIEKLEKEMKVTAKIRYSHKPAECTIKMIDNDTIECKFTENQRAITPGQSVVFYDGNIVIGGGVIK